MAKTKTVLKDSIDLNKIYNPHELVLDAYKKANAEHLFFPHESRYINENRVFIASNASDPPAKIHQRIQSIYRKRVGKTEWLLLHNRLWSHDFFHNLVEWSRGPLGVVEVPVITRKRSINVAAMKSDDMRVSPYESEPEISRFDTVYLWEFEKYKDQLLRWRDEGIIPEDCHLYYWTTDGIKYKVQKFEDFINLSGDDLILLGKVGHRFSGILKGGDAQSVEALRTLLKEEIQKGLLSVNK